MKLCKDCKYYRDHPYANTCAKHVYVKIDPIDGHKSELGENYCSSERSRTRPLFERVVNFMFGDGFQDYCGPKGKHYEAMH